MHKDVDSISRNILSVLVTCVSVTHKLLCTRAVVKDAVKVPA